MRELSHRVPERPDVLLDHIREVPLFRAFLRSIECGLLARQKPLEAPVLDLGCGDGHFAAMACDSPPRLGVDVDPDTLRAAQARGSLTGVANANADALPVAPAAFRTVVANCSIEHMDNLEGVLSEVARVMQDGGRFLFGVPSPCFGKMLFFSTMLRWLGLTKPAARYGDWFNAHSIHRHIHSPETWLGKLSAVGLEVESWEYYMSPAGHRLFDLFHYLGIPNWIWWKLTGKWVIFPNSPLKRLTALWLSPYLAGQQKIEKGAYIYFVCRRPTGIINQMRASASMTD